MMDKRSARFKHHRLFADAIGRYKADPGAALLPVSRPGQGPNLGNRGGQGCLVRVCVRKRPLFPKEASGKGEFDCVTVHPECPSATVHTCSMHANMRDCFLKHEGFPCDAAYGEETTTDQIYKQDARPLVLAAMRGGCSTIFAFGQTGSGKTFTMKGLEELATQEIFMRRSNQEAARHRLATSGGPAAAGTSGGSGSVEVGVTFFEIAGRNVVDLLGSAPGSLLTLREDSKGRIQAVGETTLVAASPEELLAIVEKGKARRATEATNVNAGSSRSHAVLKLTIGMPRRGPREHAGRLMLVDCAGSERKEDSMYHSAERRKECGEINASLHSLKECFRAMVSGNPEAHVPYRSSNLTKVLMETLTTKEAETLMIATLSPTATDIEHSVSTLRTVCLLGGSDGRIVERKEELAGEVVRPDVVPPQRWSPDEVAEWVSHVEGERYRQVALDLPPTCDGKQFTRWGENKFIALCHGKEVPGRKLYQALRSELERVAAIQKQAREANRSKTAKSATGVC